MISRTRKRLRVLKRQCRRALRRLSKHDRYAAYRPSRADGTKRVVITEWNSQEGRALLARAGHACAFYRLAHHYQQQANPFYCGVASIVTALNTLRLTKGKVPSQKELECELPSGEVVPYRLYSQATLLDARTDKVKSKEAIAPCYRPKGKTAEPFYPGLDLHEVAAILKIYGAACRTFHAELPPEAGTARLVEHLKQHLGGEDAVIIANFDGARLGARTGGHYSLLAAYDEQSGQVLVLDTAAHKNPWFWVPASHLYAAMNTRPAQGAFFRGYLVVSDD